MSEPFDQEIGDTLTEEFIRPESEFKGKKIRKLTPGSEIIMYKTMNAIFVSKGEEKIPEDEFMYSIWSYLFAHITPLKLVIALAWDKDPNIYRLSVVEWASEFKKPDSINAIEVVTKEIGFYKNQVDYSGDPSLTPPEKT